MADLLAQFAAGRLLRVLDTTAVEPVERAGGNFSQHLAHGVPVLADEDNPAVRGERNNRHPARMGDHLPDMLAAVYAEDRVATNRQ
jgi:hypothetical protein